MNVDTGAVTVPERQAAVDRRPVERDRTGSLGFGELHLAADGCSVEPTVIRDAKSPEPDAPLEAGVGAL